MRPHTPTLNISHPAPGTIGPTSPPDTPTTTSPVLNRTPASNGQPPPAKTRYQTTHHPSSIRPLGGTHFSYNPAPRPEEISPQLSHSSDAESGASSSPSPSSIVDVDIEPELQPEILAAAIDIDGDDGDDAGFAIEILSDCPLGIEYENVPVLLPDDYEYPESDGSRSRSRSPPCIDPVMEGVQNMNPFDDSEGEFDHDDEFVKQLRDNRQKRRQKRMQSGSISKRTVSERGSDSDREDTGSNCDSSEQGYIRRTRRKVGDRISIQLTGNLPERIEELKEPLSEDEIILEDAEVFARELPYWTLMDVDSE
ncbi:hypothetical protein F4810DRAFT_310068 [Camillea tinctor]|nr:hypothetical protein F4810DRAFT_310068 [Camillea tinctor]